MTQSGRKREPRSEAREGRRGGKSGWEKKKPQNIQDGGYERER